MSIGDFLHKDLKFLMSQMSNLKCTKVSEKLYNDVSFFHLFQTEPKEGNPKSIVTLQNLGQAIDCIN